VGIAGAHEALGRGTWFLKPATVRVVFGEPISTERIAQALQQSPECLLDLIRERLTTCVEQADYWRASSSPNSIEDLAATPRPLV